MKPQSTGRPESKPLPTATTLVAKESPVTTPTCCYCNQQHRSLDCTVVTQVDERKQLLRRTGRCFSCLRKGHLSRNCRTTSRCQTCRGKHPTTVSQSATESTTSNFNPSAPEFTPTEHASTLCVNASKPVLLQTASAIVSNPHDSSASFEL